VDLTHLVYKLVWKMFCGFGCQSPHVPFPAPGRDRARSAEHFFKLRLGKRPTAAPPPVSFPRVDGVFFPWREACRSPVILPQLRHTEAEARLYVQATTDFFRSLVLVFTVPLSSPVGSLRSIPPGESPMEFFFFQAPPLSFPAPCRIATSSILPTQVYLAPFSHVGDFPRA